MCVMHGGNAIGSFTDFMPGGWHVVQQCTGCEDQVSPSEVAYHQVHLSIKHFKLLHAACPTRL